MNENNLTAKEKAYELVFHKFLEETYVMRINKESTATWAVLTPEEANETAKQCALICVDEILTNNKQLDTEYDGDFHSVYGVENYWNEVKEEIKLLDTNLDSE